MSIDAQTLTVLSQVVDQQLGLYFPEDRHSDLERAMGYVAQDFGFKDSLGCVHWLLNHAEHNERNEILSRYLTIGETYFFRDKKIFSGLSRELIPEIMKGRESFGCNKIRIWSAACSTGEEAYSIAITLDREAFLYKAFNFDIFATDINLDSLEKAMGAKYSEWSFRDVPDSVRDAYFRREDSVYHLSPSIREKVTFSSLNLVHDNYPPLSHTSSAMDIIFCRNVLIYFDENRRQEIICKLSKCLGEGGFLITSPSELSLIRRPELRSRKLECGVTVFEKKPKAEAIFSIPVPQKEFSSLQPEKKQEDISMKKEISFVIPQPKVESKNKAVSCKKILEDFDKGHYSSVIDLLGPVATKKESYGSLKEDDVIMLLAKSHANMGDCKKALRLGQEAVSRDKINPGHHYFLATIHIELNQTDQATAALNKAIFLDHQFIMAYFTLATISPIESAHKHLKTVLSILEEKQGDEIIPFSDGISADHLIEITKSMIPKQSQG